MKPRQSTFMDQDHQNQQWAPECILHINFKNIKNMNVLVFCRTTFIEECLHILPFHCLPLLSPPGLGWIYFNLFVAWHRLVVQRSESQEEQDPHMKTCQSRGFGEGRQERGQERCHAASPTGLWKENTFLSHSLPVCWISLLESGKRRHKQTDAHSRHLVKVV